MHDWFLQVLKLGLLLKRFHHAQLLHLHWSQFARHHHRTDAQFSLVFKVDEVPFKEFVVCLHLFGVGENVLQLLLPELLDGSGDSFPRVVLFLYQFHVVLLL